MNHKRLTLNQDNRKSSMDDNSNLLNVIDENSAFVPETTMTDSSVPSMSIGDSDSGIVEQA